MERELETFVDLKGFEEKYEINTIYPHEIRNKKTNKILSESIKPNGYVQLFLNRIPYYKHRLVAKQFILNPENLPVIDHINHVKSDNRIDNLRWVSYTDNNKNKISSKNIVYNFIDYAEFDDDDLMQVDCYNDHEFEDYYYNIETNRFYYDTGVNYRELHINYSKYCSAYVFMKDMENKSVNIYFNKFKRLHDIL